MLAAFFTSSVCPGPAFAGALPATDTSRSPFLILPSELGNIDAWNETPGASPLFDAGAPHPFILHIQDAHANPDAQKKIRGLLESVAAQKATPENPLLVALEGARGPIHPEYLRFSAEHPEVDRAIVRDLLEKGELSGAELFAWEENLKAPEERRALFFGAEDMRLYRRNLATYRTLLFERLEIDSLLAPLRGKAEVAQSKIFSPEIRQFLKEKQRRKEGHYEQSGSGSPQLASYLDYLTLRAREVLKIDLDNPAEQIRFPNLVRLLAASHLSKSVDAAKAQVESRALLREDDNKSMDRLRAEKIWQDVQARGTAADAKDAMALIGIRALHSEVEVSGLFREMEQLESWLMKKMAQKDSEMALVKILERLAMLDKLMRLELTREEEGVVDAQTDSLKPSALMKELVALDPEDKKVMDLSRLENIFSDALFFYETARRRDRALFEHALAQAKPETRVLVIVTGGFHSSGMVELFTQRGFAFGVVQPKIDKLDSELPARVFRDENADLPEAQGAEKLSKQEALLLKEVLETGSNALREKGLGPEQVAEALGKMIREHPLLKNTVEVLPAENTTGSLPKIRVRTETPKQAVSETLLTGRGYRSMRAPVRKSGPRRRAATARRSEMRTDRQRDLADLKQRIDVELGLIAGIEDAKRRQAALKNIRDLSVRNLDLKEELVKYLKDKKGISASNADAVRNIEEALRFVQGIGIVGVGGAMSTAAMLGSAGHYLSAIDEPGSLEQMKASQAIDLALISGIEQEGRLSYQNRSQEDFNRLVAENDVIYLDAAPRPEADYNDYKNRLYSFAMQLGDALKDVRDKGLKARKVFIVRGQVGVETSERIFDIIKFHARSNDRDYLNYDVVYQPDLSTRQKDGTLIEPYAVFGLRTQRVTEQVKTRQVLKQVYEPEKIKNTEIETMDIRSAEEGKDALLIFLATKLAHFNDLAQLGDRYGADLSVVALGAGLDKRIQNEFINPSLGFGGRLLFLLRGIRAERLNRAAGIRSQSPGEIEAVIDAAIKRLRAGKPIFEILDELPPDLHLLFWLENVLRINEQNRQYFLERKILAGYPNIRDKKVSILGVGYSQRNGEITESPALGIIRTLVKKHGVREFYVADPNAEAAFKQWAEAMRKKDPDYQSVVFNFGSDAYETLKQGDVGIIATDSNAEVFQFDLKRLAEVLDGKPLFDGINVFGLRADGERLYALEDVRSAHLVENTPANGGINLTSVGRPSLGPRLDAKASYRLTDSAFYQTLDAYPVKEFKKKNVAIVGGGYVGLVTAANLATQGHRVHAVEIKKMQKRIDDLNSEQTILPIHEPGLREKIVEAKTEIPGTKERTIFFSTELDQAVRESPIVYLAVGTPQQTTGEIDLTYILSAAEEIGATVADLKAKQAPDYFRTIVIKSTVTPNTFEEIEKVMRKKGLISGIDYALVSNPEFLREGHAMEDVTKPDRTVLGFYNRIPDLPSGTDRGAVIGQIQQNLEKVQREMLELWFPLMQSFPHKVLVTDSATSTLIKYAANSYLASSITLSNILAQDTSLVGGDYLQVRRPLKKDRRIGPFAFLDPGCGFGGSCFPKDVQALDFLSVSKTGHPLLGIQLSHQMNEYYKMLMVDKTVERLTEFPQAKSPLEGKRIAVWGITFKPDTDDVRDAPSARILYELLKRGAESITLHDPIFNIPQPDAPPKEVIIARFIEETYKVAKADHSFTGTAKEFAEQFQRDYVNTGRVKFTDHPREVFANQPDALLLVTQWKVYGDIPPQEYVPADRPFLIVDGRNQLYRKIGDIETFGNVAYVGVGSPEILGARSEMRQSRPGLESVKAQLGDLLRQPLSTAEWTRALGNFQISGPFGQASESDLMVRYPAMGPARDFSRRWTGSIYGDGTWTSLPPRLGLRLLQTEFSTPAASGAANPVLDLMREKMGDRYAALSGDRSNPIHLIYALRSARLPQGAVAFLSDAGPSDQLTFVTPFSQARAQKIQEKFRRQLQKVFNLPEALAARLVVVGAGSRQALAGSIQKVAGEDRDRTVGVMDKSFEFLENEVGHIRGKDRLHNDRINEDTSFLLSAMLLRNQFPDHYAVRNIRNEIQSRGLDFEDISQRVGQVIAAIRHIATMA